MFRAEVQILRWVSGTIFGREVVPEVCRMSAMSSGPGAAVTAAAAPSPSDNVNVPAGPVGSGDSSATGKERSAATCRAGLSMSRSTIRALARKSVR